jgi:hypothetical protein
MWLFHKATEARVYKDLTGCHGDLGIEDNLENINVRLINLGIDEVNSMRELVQRESKNELLRQILMDPVPSIAGLSCFSHVAKSLSAYHDGRFNATSVMMSAFSTAEDVTIGSKSFSSLTIPEVFSACTKDSDDDKDGGDNNKQSSLSASEEIELVPAFTLKRPVPMRLQPDWSADVHPNLSVGENNGVGVSCSSVLVCKAKIYFIWKYSRSVDSRSVDS